MYVVRSLSVWMTLTHLHGPFYCYLIILKQINHMHVPLMKNPYIKTDCLFDV